MKPDSYIYFFQAWSWTLRYCSQIAAARRLHVSEHDSSNAAIHRMQGSIEDLLP